MKAQTDVLERDSRLSGAPIGYESVLKVRWLFAVFLLLLSTFRLYYASTHGLVNDEAYYWMWARRLAPGYYDQGPGIALAIRLGLLFGSGSGAVRLAAVLDAAVVAVVAYLMSSRIFKDERAGAASGVFINIIPLFFAGGILATHDSPQMASWAVALYFLLRATSEERPELGWWAFVGVFAGISLDCKFTAVLFFPCLLLFLYRSRKRYAWLRTVYPYLSGAIALGLFSPVVYWNATHSWAAARHILNLGGAQRHQLLDTGAVGDFLGGQIVVALLFFFTLAWAATRAWKEGRDQDAPGMLLCACFSGPLWLFFLLLSFHGKVEPNWPVPSYFSAAVVAPWMVWKSFQSAVGVNRWLSGSFHLVSGVLAVVGITVLLYPECIRLLPHGNQLAQQYRRNDRTNEMYGWMQLADAVLNESADGEWLPAAARYQDAAELSFSLPRQPIVYNLPVVRRHNQYDFWPPMPDGANSVVVVLAKEADGVRPQLQQLFSSVSEASRVRLWRQPLYEQPIVEYILFRCNGYRGGREGLMRNEW